jgi:hypothetical protein
MKLKTELMQQLLQERNELEAAMKKYDLTAADVLGGPW